MERRLISTLSRLIGGGKGTAMAPMTRPSTNEAAPVRPEHHNKIAYLSAMRIFGDLSPEDMKMIDKSTVMTTAGKGKMVYMPGETGDVIFLLKKGSVHLYRVSSEGRKFIVQTIGPMTFFGEMATLGHNMHDLFAEAAEECLLCVMGRADIERMILWKPQIGLRIIEEIGQRMHDVQKRLGDSVFKGVPARVASLLLKVSNDGEYPVKGLTHQDLADMLGVYRETVTNALNGLRDDGSIDVSRKAIVLRNVDALRNVAEEEILRKR